MPALADRRRDRLGPMVGCGVLTLVLAVVLASTRALPVAVGALVLVGGPAGVGSSLLFAHLRQTGARTSDIVNTRAIVSVAWVAGPPLATVIIGGLGDRAILLAAGAVAVLATTSTVALSVRDRKPSTTREEAQATALRKRASRSRGRAWCSW